ncbi:MAG: RNA polymerase sigma-70 factor [Phocaeicola sp.]|uniref:RNA polymerase sigma-70 factor n=1 Tax=Phocaeicola TaxID=909656 RepID=UPI00234E5FC6|nr:RNA polymerase sigma-70 factor [Phocaeicola oris]MCE2615924.1 RNA polymerase sigma-70 factor [Phocaeicola oris]
MRKGQNFDKLWNTEADFDKIYKIYYPKLVRFANTYLLSISDSENIVQDIFLQVWEAHGNIPYGNHIHAYLFTAVKNRCIDFLRSLKKRETSHLSDVEQKELDLKLYSLEMFDEQGFTLDELEKAITDAIASLPESCRRIFLLSRMEGLTYKEIAEQLDVSINTVEGQMSVALRKLRSVLKDYLYLFLFIC